MKKMIRKAVVTGLLLTLSLSAAYFSVRGRIAKDSQDYGRGNDILADEAGAQGEARRQEDVTEDGKDDGIYCTILGDSIAKGYSGDKAVQIECYGDIAAREIAESLGRGCEVVNYAKNGLSTEGMNDKVLQREEVTESISQSDVIFITVGSNDLLNECKSVVQNILKADTKFKTADEALEVLESSVRKNPFLLLRAINALSNWNYEEFEEQWVDMMTEIRRVGGTKPKIIVTNIYNPVANRKLPSTMNQVVEDIIGNMNHIMEKHSERYGYLVADAASSAVPDNVQKDGLHPNQEGQRILAGLVAERYRVIAENE